MAEVFDDMEMQEREQWQRMQGMRNRFPEYDDFYHDILDTERDKLLSDDEQRPDKADRLVYVHKLLKQPGQPAQAETSFTDSNDGNTVALTTRDGNAVEVPSVEFVSIDSDNYGNVDDNTFNLAFKQTEEI